MIVSDKDQPELRREYDALTGLLSQDAFRRRFEAERAAICGLRRTWKLRSRCSAGAAVLGVAASERADLFVGKTLEVGGRVTPDWITEY